MPQMGFVPKTYQQLLNLFLDGFMHANDFTCVQKAAMFDASRQNRVA
jgi:hypothetical protein